MRGKRIYIILAIISLLLLSGCSNHVVNDGSRIVVQERTGASDEYRFLRSISDEGELEDAKDILNKINWKNAIADMAYPPDCKFKFEGDASKDLVYQLWINPLKDSVELTIEGRDKYYHLSREKSEKLFRIITGKSLDAE